MANITTVTRPYAKAVLAIAQSQNDFAKWSQMLELLSLIVQDETGNNLITNLAISPQNKVAFICSVAGEHINAECINLLKVLARAKRLLIIPELYKLYEDMRREFEGVVIIDLTMAQAVDKAEFDTVVADCRKNFEGDVIIRPNIDAELISGGVAQIGNRVVDASVFGRLTAMRNLLRK